MLPVRYRQYGHIQDAGSAIAPNHVCERCGTAIYGPKAQNPKVMALAGVVTFIVAVSYGEPTMFLWFIGVVTVVLKLGAVLRVRS